MDWSAQSNPWFKLSNETVQALQKFDPVLNRVPDTNDGKQWNFLLTVWSAYAKSVHAMTEINRYDSWTPIPINRPSEDRYKHIALWGTLDSVTMSMHSALDNLAHAVFLLQNPDPSKDYRPPSFLDLFDKSGTLKRKVATWGAPSDLAALLQQLHRHGGKRIAHDSNRSKHRRSFIPRPEIPSEMLSLPFYSPLIAQPDSTLLSNWADDVKATMESALPIFWESLSQVTQEWNP